MATQRRSSSRVELTLVHPHVEGVQVVVARALCAQRLDELLLGQACLRGPLVPCSSQFDLHPVVSDVDPARNHKRTLGGVL